MAVVDAPIWKEWLEKLSAGMLDNSRMDSRCFCNQKRVAGLLESSTKSRSGREFSLQASVMQVG